MAERDLRPTPTQAENDAGARGEHIEKKEYDGSPLQLDAMAKPEVPPSVDPTPIAGSLDPNTAEVGGPDVVMKVNGLGFTPTSVIVWNGGDEATTFVSDTQVTTGVKPSTASGPWTIPVAVRNGDKLSNELLFSFTEAPDPPVTRNKSKK